MAGARAAQQVDMAGSSASAGIPALPLGQAPVAEQVDGVKVHLSRLHSHEKELLEVIENAKAECEAEVVRAMRCTPRWWRQQSSTQRLYEPHQSARS